MRDRGTRCMGLAALLALSVGLSGCVAAAAGGAAAGIYFTDQSAESVVNAPIGEVAARTRVVLGEMRIIVQERQVERANRELEIHGVAPAGQTVHVELDESGGATRVKVSARENAVRWDKAYARSVVERIVQGF